MTGNRGHKLESDFLSPGRSLGPEMSLGAMADLRLRKGKGKEERKLKERGREEQRSPEPGRYTLRDRE